MLHLVSGIAMVCTLGQYQDFSIEKFPSSPGLYYDNIGKVQIYSVTWKIVSYINLDELQGKADETERLSHLSVSHCKQKLNRLGISDQECTTVEQALEWHVKKIRTSQSLIGQLTRHETRRKRGVMNFVGEISKILFGTLDEQDASYFKSKIDLIENEQRQLLKLTKEQVTVVKATLSSFNHTVTSLARNEEVIVNNMEKLHRYMKEYVNSTDQKIQHLAVLTAVNEQLIQLVSIYTELEREYEMLISAIVNAQKGILEPHIINPVQIVKYLHLIRDDIKDKKFPIALTEQSGYQLLRIIDVDAFMSGHILSYVLNVPLVENELFNLYKVLPLPSEIDGEQNLFMYIQPETDYLLIDEAKRHYAKLSNEQLLCKELDRVRKICKQKFVLRSTYDHETCEARMLQPVREIPSDCLKKIVKLNESIWTPLSRDQWLFVAPKDDGLTILCNNNKPTDVLVRGTGKLTFYGKCKGYGTQVFIQSEQIIRINVTTEDIVPALNMQIDCCVINTERKNISELKLHMPLEHVVQHLDDLKVAGHKLSEIEEEIAFQEKYNILDIPWYQYSFWSYLGVVILAIIFIGCLCKYCKCFRDCFKYAWKGMGDDCCGRICVRTTMVNTSEGSEMTHIRGRRPLRSSRRNSDEPDVLDEHNEERRSLPMPAPRRDQR